MLIYSYPAEFRLIRTAISYHRYIDEIKPAIDKLKNVEKPKMPAEVIKI